jgi:hypothetical protein
VSESPGLEAGETDEPRGLSDQERMMAERLIAKAAALKEIPPESATACWHKSWDEYLALRKLLGLDEPGRRPPHKFMTEPLDK